MSAKPLDPSDSPTVTRDVGEGNTLSRPSFPHSSLAPGQTFGPYRIHRLLGKGGMGEVYEAEQRDSGRRVALKVLADPDPLPEARERFLREGRLAAAVNHPNSVYIYGTEEIDGQWAISMELLAGGSLKDRMREKGPLPPQEAVDAILQIIDGLEAAASAGVLHRDVKPANCFVELDGTVKIGDFGLSLSTLARDRSRSHLTQSGTLMGTPAFASPEQLRGEDLDVRSDVYSVGATLFYLLTGRAPFEADNLMQLLTTIAEKPPETPRRLQPKIPRGLANIILKCLAKTPDGRPKDYSALRESLAGFGASHETVDASGRHSLATLADATLVYGLAYLASRSPAFSSLDATWLHGPGRLPAALLVSSLLVFSPFAIGSESFGEQLLRVRVLTSSGQTLSTRERWTRWVAACLVAFFSGVLVDPPLWTVAVIAFYLTTPFGLARLKAINAVVRSRPFVAPASETGSPAGERIGPYSVLPMTTERSDRVVAFDPLLRRRVWIRRFPWGEMDEAREARGNTRLRWLASGREAQCDWRAYEAPSGESLRELKEALPWSKARFIIRDLARDLATGLKEAALPRVLSLQHVWITGPESCRLLEFLPPGESASNDRSYSGADEGELLKFLHVAAMRLIAAPGQPYLLPQDGDCFLRDLESGGTVASLHTAAVVSEYLARGEISTAEGHADFLTSWFPLQFAMLLTSMPLAPRDNNAFLRFLYIMWSVPLGFVLLGAAFRLLPLREGSGRFRADGSEVSAWTAWWHDALWVLPPLTFAGLALSRWPDGHWVFAAPLLALGLVGVIASRVDKIGLHARLTGTRKKPVHRL